MDFTSQNTNIDVVAAELAQFSCSLTLRLAARHGFLSGRMKRFLGWSTVSVVPVHDFVGP